MPIYFVMQRYLSSKFDKRLEVKAMWNKGIEYYYMLYLFLLIIRFYYIMNISTFDSLYIFFIYGLLIALIEHSIGIYLNKN